MGSACVKRKSNEDEFESTPNKYLKRTTKTQVIVTVSSLDFNSVLAMRLLLSAVQILFSARVALFIENKRSVLCFCRINLVVYLLIRAKSRVDPFLKA